MKLAKSEIWLLKQELAANAYGHNSGIFFTFREGQSCFNVAETFEIHFGIMQILIHWTKCSITNAWHNLYSFILHTKWFSMPEGRGCPFLGYQDIHYSAKIIKKWTTFFMNGKRDHKKHTMDDFLW